MKKKFFLTAIALWLITVVVNAQGFLVIDQQSTIVREGFVYSQYNAPLGQSFTPSLSAIGFVSLYLGDADYLNEVGGTMYVNLRSDSIAGTILASTAPVFLPGAFFGTTNFLFSSAVSLNPGTVYYIEPLIQSGNTSFGMFLSDGTYTRGALIKDGVTLSDRNLWFQEGIIAVPEPSTMALSVLGGLLLGYRRWKR